MPEQTKYDCDTRPYWVSEEAYHDRERRFGMFIEEGRGYRIDDPDTPRPWLNYFANPDFGAVLSNRGLGFTWYRSTLLRLTKYEHPIDYLPRTFEDGREIILEDSATGETTNVLREAKDLVCVHRPGTSTITARVRGVEITFTLFVPLEDTCEIWLVCVKDTEGRVRPLRLRFEQTWSFAKFGIHTAEEGIPYVSEPGRDLEVEADESGVRAHSTNAQLPYELFGFFQSPQAGRAEVIPLPETRLDGRRFVFHRCVLEADAAANGTSEFCVVSGVAVTRESFDRLRGKYRSGEAARAEWKRVKSRWDDLQKSPSCELPDKPLQYFLNTWFKNQLNLTFPFVRSGQAGYRDTLQDAWGYTLLDPAASRERLLEILAHQLADGTAPRNYSRFDDGRHDRRRFMDSPVWIPRTLVDWIKETGDFALLDEVVPFLDGGEATVEEHVRRALDYLYGHRGRHGACLTGDGDWNDALEGIGKQGDAESVWLTIALYDALRLMEELYRAAGRLTRADEAAARAVEISSAVNGQGWDGAWYVYGFTGSGAPIGSSRNREGRIHLNAQAWAVFSGLADEKRARAAMRAVAEHLDSPLGPALLAPSYVHEAGEVGRIARLEPGTFENGSIYQHAVAFKIMADVRSGNSEQALRTFLGVLPTNPENFDSRRTSEPYCTGNYYCGPGHPRFGQNFFSWFTGNSAWFLRIGFDEMLGVRAGFHGLEIVPRAPASWKTFSMWRRYRGCLYHIAFRRGSGPLKILIDGREIEGAVIPVQNKPACRVEVALTES